jgi:CoA-dependent NAD(P)H sulfur oxidoreductase
MPGERLLVIGGVAAGMSAASRARKLRPELEIVVLEKGRHVSYGACGLPYYVGGRVKDAEDLVVYDADYFRKVRKIDMRLEHEAIEIQPGRKTVVALERGARLVELPYDKLVIATGAAPLTNIPGADTPGVFTVNDLATTVHLRALLDERKPRCAVIIGSGYIGLEMAEALGTRGLEVAIVERSGALAAGFGAAIEAKVKEALGRHGVRFHTDARVTAIVPGRGGAVESVSCGAGTSLPADLVVLATGLRPRTALAENAGIEIGSTGAIAVDERMQTNLPGIYAAGDCAETRHLLTRRPVYFPLGTTANKQGRVAGENAAGGNARFEGIVGTLVTKVFELELAHTGLNATEARAAGFQSDEVTLEAFSRARYFGGQPLTITLVWDRAGGKLLGCQMAGCDGVAKRIDVAALALHAEMRVQDMLHLDLSYAPPCAPVWDALLVAANEAAKKITGR